MENSQNQLELMKQLHLLRMVLMKTLSLVMILVQEMMQILLMVSDGDGYITIIKNVMQHFVVLTLLNVWHNFLNNPKSTLLSNICQLTITHMYIVFYLFRY